MLSPTESKLRKALSPKWLPKLIIMILTAQLARSEKESLGTTVLDKHKLYSVGVI